MQKTTVLSSILIFVLGISLGAYIVYANPTSTFYISAGKYPSGVSYTIWKEGSSYFAKDGNGLTPSWGLENSNFSQVWQNTVNYGKEIFITAGFYYQDTQLNIGKFVTIVGEGINQTTIRATTQNMTMIYIANSSQPGNEMRGVTLRDLNIDGNDKARNGIIGINCTMNNHFQRLAIHRVWDVGFYLEDSWDNSIADLWIYNIGGVDHGYGASTGTGLFLNRSGECVVSNVNFISSTADAYCAFRVRRGFGLSIIGCTISKWGDYGLYIAGSRGVGVYGSLMEKNLINAIKIVPDSGYISINIGVHDCHLKSAETDPIVAIDGYYCSFTGNFFDIDRGSGGKHWAITNGAGNSFDWTNHYLRQGSGSTCVYTDSGSRTKLIVDRSCGSDEASNDDWIQHHVYSTPTVIVVSVEESDATYFVQVKAKNSTHFQIYLYDHTAGAVETTDKTINWFAEYRP